PPLSMLATKAVLPNEAAASVSGLMTAAWRAFAADLGLTLVLGVFVLLALRRRRAWLRRFADTFHEEAVYQKLPRLVVHTSIVVALIVLSLALNLLFQIAFLLDFGLGGGTAVDSLAGYAAALIVALMPLALALVVPGLRQWLHIVMDVINHFYRRRAEVPWP